MRRLAMAVVLLAACSGGAAVETTTTTTAPVTTTTTLSDTTTTAPPPDCPAAPYELTVLPAGVGEGEFDSTVEPDVWTSVAGTNTTFVPRTDDTVAIALIRGTLPAVDWPAEKGEVDIDGTRAVAGPHPDGTWVAGWFEEPGERCDQYTMVFYPPWNPADVEQVLAGMNRVGG
ncbi:MAG TPA: hypothetical protein VFT85_03995 [Acidimicrobiia bacterium]|nr:hypothetical protein [Acidimicrobiia bacterium]